MRQVTAFICVLVLALAAPGAALAQSSGEEGYSGPGGVSGQVQEQTDSGSSRDDDGGGGSLPFSGRDLIVLAAAGATLLAIGFGLRRGTMRA